MAPSGESSIEHLWTESEGNEEQRGPLFDIHTNLTDAFKDVSTLPGLPSTVEQHGTSLVSIIQEVETRSTPYLPESKNRRYTFEVKTRQKAGGEVSIGIQGKPGSKTAQPINPLYEYIINADGSVVRTDEFDDGEPVSEEEIELIKKASDVLTTKINGSVANIQADILLKERRASEEKQLEIERSRARGRRVVRGFGITALSLGVVAGIGIGGQWAWTEWIHKPGVAEEERRAAYDAEGYSIPGDSIELNDQTLITIPTADYDEIPDYKAGESLEGPRLVGLDSDDCAVVTIEGLEGKSVKVGVSQYNPLAEYSVTAYASGNELHVCTTEEVDSELETEDTKFALELVESSDR
ncbi:MAG: hypothetical protein V4611_04950 [Patescibacteria group bacterium]